MAIRLHRWYIPMYTIMTLIQYKPGWFTEPPDTEDIMGNIGASNMKEAGVKTGDIADTTEAIIMQGVGTKTAITVR